MLPYPSCGQLALGDTVAFIVVVHAFVVVRVIIIGTALNGSRGQVVVGSNFDGNRSAIRS